MATHALPPEPGKGMSIKVDQDLHDDLLLLMQECGMSMTDAVKYGVAKLAMEKRERIFRERNTTRKAG